MKTADEMSPRSGEVGVGAPRATAAQDLKGRVIVGLGRFGVVILAAGLVVLFSVLRPATFATVANYREILNGQTVVVTLALGSMVPLIVGEFDLSVASVLTTVQILVVGLVSQHGLSPAVAIPSGVGFGVVVGLINGLLVVKAKVTAFVATLAVGSVCSGVGLWYTGGQVLYGNVPHAFTDLGRRSVAGAPLPVVYTAVLALAMWAVLSYLPVGRRLYATGGNRKAAKLTGIDTERYVIGSFVTAGMLAAAAGVLLGAQLGSATADTSNTLLLPAIAGAFLGATTIRPGQFNAWGTVAAVYALSIAISGLEQFGTPTWVQPVFNGVALALAVGLSGWGVRSRGRRARVRQLMLLRERRG